MPNEGINENRNISSAFLVPIASTKVLLLVAPASRSARLRVRSFVPKKVS